MILIKSIRFWFGLFDTNYVDTGSSDCI